MASDVILDANNKYLPHMKRFIHRSTNIFA